MADTKRLVTINLTIKEAEALFTASNSLLVDEEAASSVMVYKREVKAAYRAQDKLIRAMRNYKEWEAENE